MWRWLGRIGKRRLDPIRMEGEYVVGVGVGKRSRWQSVRLPVEKKLSIPDSSDVIVLAGAPGAQELGCADEDHAAMLREWCKDIGSESCLYRIGTDGQVIWAAELPPGEPGVFDCYVHAEMENGQPWGNTWSCYACRINLKNGRIISRVFTK